VGTSVSINRFYRTLDNTGVYRIIDISTTGEALLMTTPSYPTCARACLYTPTPTPTNTDTPLPATYTPTPTNTLTPTSTPTLPEGVSGFESTDGGFQQCGNGMDYEYYRTYQVYFTGPRTMGGYVVVILSDYNTITISFNENDTYASQTIFCGCGSPCADMQDVINVIYITPTPTPTADPNPTSTPGTECWQYAFSGTIYGSQQDCENNENGPCNQVVCPEGPQV
jgi:hypothetical protein